MKERPILFSGPMVRAILDGKKRQTRRVIKSFKHAGFDCIKDWDGGPSRLDIAPANWELCPHGVPGDRLWVRETWTIHPDGAHEGVLYRATDPGWDDNNTGLTWKPSIFMRREICRIVLEVTDVRVERLQKISHEDAKAEGVPDRCCDDTPRDSFADLWQALNSKRGYGWEVNPWVWVVSFKRINDENN